MKLKFVNKVPKNETIQYNHRYRRHKPDYINSDHWRNKHCTIYHGVGLPVGIALMEIAYFFLLQLPSHESLKSLKIFTVKQEKHDAIKLLAQGKLESIANIILQAMQGEDISPAEFHKVQQEEEKYRTTDIRNQVKVNVKEITKEQQEEILGRRKKKRRKKRRQIRFFRKIANSSGTKSANVIKNMKPIHPTACGFMVDKDYKICLSSMWNQLQNPAPHLSRYRSSCHHPSQYFF